MKKLLFALFCATLSLVNGQAFAFDWYTDDSVPNVHVPPVVIRCPSSSVIANGLGNCNFGSGTPSSTSGVTPYVSPSAESCKVVKASQGTLVGVSVTSATGNGAGYLQVINTATAPTTGNAVVLAAQPVFVPAGPASVSKSFVPPNNIQMGTGITVCFTQNASPYTYTSGTNVTFEVFYQ